MVSVMDAHASLCKSLTRQISCLIFSTGEQAKNIIFQNKIFSVSKALQPLESHSNVAARGRNN